MNKKSFLVPALVFVNVVVIGFFFFRYCSSTAPMVGHDYRLFIPHLIDNYLYQKINGLSVHWYTPSFAGGEPVYSNPEDIQFSLPQLLVWFFDPWRAIRLSMVFYIIFGFITTYYFLRKLVEFNSYASILGAVFFIANGFYIQHMAVGHVTFQMFPLFGVILIVLFNPKFPYWFGGLLLSILFAHMLYSGTLHIFIFFFLTILVTLPIIYLLKPSLLNSKRLFLTTVWGLGLSALVCGSKLWAIYSLMQFSPRLAGGLYSTDWLTGISRMVSQLLGSMTIAPIYAIVEGNTIKYVAASLVATLKQYTGSLNYYWELDMSLSPALLILLLFGATTFLFHKPNWKTPIVKRRLIAEICLIIAIWIVTEFSLGRGILYPYLHKLPLLNTLRTNYRFTCAFIFPLSVVGAAIFNKWTSNWKSNIRLLLIFILFDGLAITSMWVYYKIPTEYQWRYLDLRTILPVYPEIRYKNETFPVEKVVPDAHPWEVFQLHATNLIDPYDTLFDPFEENFKAVLHQGPVYDIDNGYYNIINPTGYVYPEVNHSEPFERISVSDKGNFLNFINRRQTNWKLPVIQQVLNWTTLFTLIAEFGIILIYLAKKWFRFSKKDSKA